MYKVFCNDSELILASKNENWSKEKYYEDHKVFLNEKLTSTFIEKRLKTKKKKSYIFLFDRGVVKAWKEFTKSFKYIKAGGGIVTNKNGEILSIFRKGKWDLAKGKLESGETEEEGSVREVEEETGVKVEIIHHQPLYSYHMYSMHNILYIKRTAWFKMTCINDKKMKPQKKEGISKVRWLNQDEIKSVLLVNTYPTISGILSLY